MHTLFIIGAGASADFGLPVGPRLQECISRFVNPNVDVSDTGDACNFEMERISTELEARGVRYEQQYDLYDWVSRTLPLAASIDSFLEQQSNVGDGLSFLGKYAIATLISTFERQSPLFLEKRKKPNFTQLADSWLGRLFPLINRGGAANVDEKGLDHIAFLTFNYDRCIEQFLFLAFLEYYRMDKDSAHSLVGNVKIHHVYGSLGEFSGKGGSLPFGYEKFSQERILAADSIKTYSEQIGEEENERIRFMVDSANRVIFIGFSFLPINQKLISEVCPQPVKLKKVYGTCYGMSDADRERALAWANNIFRKGSSGASLSKLKGAEFFNENRLLFE